MFENANFGQYIPGDSYIHRLDPRIKFIALLVFLVAVIMAREPLAIGLLTLVALGIFFLSGLSWREALGSLKPVIPLLIIAFVFNVFAVGQDHHILFAWGFLKVSLESITNGLVMMLRIMTLILASNIFLSLTTSAMQLSLAITSLMSPLARIGVPVQDIGMMMSIALRFIPTLMQETDTIMKAQSSRGANYDQGGLIQRMKGFVSVLVPLFISSFRKAEGLAEAMEARAYRSDIKRGKLNPLKLEAKDLVFLVAFSLLCLLIVLWEKNLLV